MQLTFHTLQLLRTNNLRGCLGLVGLVLCSFLISAPVFAASYKVTPLVLDYTLEPRDIVNEEITITNEGGGPIRLFATVNQVATDSTEQIKPRLTPTVADMSVDASSWIAINRGRIPVAVGETVTVPMQIKVSAKAQPGIYHVYVGFPNGSNKPAAHQLFDRETVPGVLVRIEIKDDAVSLLRLSRFYIDRFMLSLRQGTAQLSIANVGTKPTSYQGEIIYYNNSGEEIASQPISSTNDLGEAERRDIVLPVPETLGFGKHKANIMLSFGANQSATVSDTIFFYVIPVPYLLLLLALMLAIILLLSYIVHRRYQVANADFSTDEFGRPVAMVRSTLKREPSDNDVTLPAKK